MTYDSAKEAADDAKSRIDKMFAEVVQVRQELAKLKSATSFGASQTMEPYPWGKAYGIEHYSSLAAARADYDRLFAKSKEVAVRNEAIAKRNRDALAAALTYLEALGVPSTYLKLKSSRSYKHVTVDAEWKTALQQSLPTATGFSAVEERYKSMIRQLDEREAKAKQAEAAIERQRAAEEKKNKAIQVAASMAARYGLEVTAPVDDVFWKIIESDKYLCLAYWMERNRGDWNEGYHYAEIGLNQFAVEDQRDREVSGEISGLISDWDGDGRCFRDCQWNYGKLYEIAAERNAQAIADFQALSEVREAD